MTTPIPPHIVEEVARQIERLADTVRGCGSDRCCCHGVSAFECMTLLSVDHIAEQAATAAIEAYLRVKGE